MPLLVIISVTGTESGVPGSLRVTIDHCSHRLWFGGRGSCTKKVQDGSYRYLLVQLKGAVDIVRHSRAFPPSRRGRRVGYALTTVDK